MSDGFNEKHLLWWVLELIDTYDCGTEDLLKPTNWRLIGAPDWAYPAFCERYEEFRNR